MRRAFAIAATAAAAVLALTGCTTSSHAGGTVWTAASSCATTSTVAATSTLSGVQFSVKNATAESPKSTGCSYLATGGTSQLNVEVQPGAPSEVQFGSAAPHTTTNLPKLGNGAESVTSAEFCALIVPASGGNTIQLQLIGSKNDLAVPCTRMPQLLDLFATSATS